MSGDAVAVHVEPVPDGPHERHEVDHLLAQAVPEPERRQGSAGERGQALGRLDAPVAVEVDAAARDPDDVGPPVARGSTRSRPSGPPP